MGAGMLAGFAANILALAIALDAASGQYKLPKQEVAASGTHPVAGKIVGMVVHIKRLWQPPPQRAL